MAHKGKKGKHHPKKRSSSRRIGATGHGSLQHTAMELVGLAVGGAVATALQRRLVNMNPKVVSGIQIVAGVMATRKFAANAFIAGIGWGVAGAGTIGLAHEFHMIAGVEDMVSGFIGGADDLGDPYLEYRMNGVESGNYMSGLQSNAYVGAMSDGDIPEMM